MASSNDTFSDARRAASRGPGGYLMDRTLNRADFSKSGTGASPLSGAATPTARPVEDDEPKENGATRMLRRRMDSQEADALGKSKDSYKAGGLVRRGFGKARGA